MTVDGFAEKTQAKKATVITWMSKGYIPGAHDNFIPDSARKPYTRRRATTGEGIIKSILKACNLQMGVCAEIYGITEAEYNTYIKGLLKCEYIISFEADGIMYYNITALGISFLNSQKRVKISDIIPAVATIASTAVPLLV